MAQIICIITVVQDTYLWNNSSTTVRVQDTGGGVAVEQQQGRSIRSSREFSHTQYVRTWCTSHVLNSVWHWIPSAVTTMTLVQKKNPFCSYCCRRDRSIPRSLQRSVSTKILDLSWRAFDSITVCLVILTWSTGVRRIISGTYVRSQNILRGSSESRLSFFSSRFFFYCYYVIIDVNSCSTSWAENG